MLMPRVILLIACIAALAAVPNRAIATGADGIVPASNAAKAPPEARIDEQIGAQVPLDLVMRDEDEQPITIRECMDGKVTILVPVYYRCPMLCTQTLNGLLEALRQMPPDFTAGGKFNIVTFSLDPKEHHSLARDKKAAYLGGYGRPDTEKGWRFLTGSKESVKTLTEAVGYRYEYDRAFKEFNHPSGLIILTPEGKVARYFYGIGFDAEYKIPGGMTTLRLSLVEASDGKIGSLTDKLTLLCYRFDHTKGYALQIMRAVQIGGILTLVLMGTGIAVALRRERRGRAGSLTPATAETATNTTRQNDGLPSGGTA